jgi:replicative DNA helicase
LGRNTKMIQGQTATSVKPEFKVPPHSIEAEQAVLGGLMLDNYDWDQVVDRITENDFYRLDHKIIFRVMTDMVLQSKPLDIITVSEALERSKDLENVGGLSYLGALAKNTPSSANIVAYADIVRERSILRQLVEVGGEITESGFEPGGRVAMELLDEAERKVFSIAERGVKSGHGPVAIAEVLARTVDRIDTLFHANSPITGISSGFNDFDKMTSGLQPSDLIVIAGRPSMGKTTFAMNIAEHAVMRNEGAVLIFSMEMPAESLAMRMLASLGRIEQQKIRSGQLSDDDWPRLTSAISMMSAKKLLIDDSGALSPFEVRARARRVMRSHGNLGLIVIDYLQLMRVPGYNEHRSAEISEISRSLKSLARDLNVPVIVLSQLNRGLEQRPEKRPVMSDLRESGAIEQDADLIVFIYRDEVYYKDSNDKGTAEIIIGKQRNGPIGTVRLTFLGQYSRFENYASEHRALEGAEAY